MNDRHLMQLFAAILQLVSKLVGLSSKSLFEMNSAVLIHGFQRERFVQSDPVSVPHSSVPGQSDFESNGGLLLKLR